MYLPSMITFTKNTIAATKRMEKAIFLISFNAVLNMVSNLDYQHFRRILRHW